MITGEDIKDLKENLTSEEIDSVVKNVKGQTKKAIFEILDKYQKDSRNVVSEAMTYAASAAIETGITGLLLMCNGQRKAVDALIADMMEHIIKNVEEIENDD